MNLGYKDKNVLVTGAGSPIGFGRQICLTLAEEGANIIVCASGMEKAIATAKLVEDKGVKALPLAFDVRDRAAVDEAVKEAMDDFGQIDVLINNAGASKLQHTPFMQMERDVWDFDIQTNLFGQMNLVQSIVPYMIENGGGRILNISGGRGIPGLSTYGAAKAGIIDWTKSIAIELAPFNIVVNVFGPGLGHTGLIEGSDPKGVEMVTNMTAQKRLNTPVDVANVVAFLASEKNSYMTGKYIENQ